MLPLNCYYYYLCYATIQSPFPLRFAGADPGQTALHVTNKGFLSLTAPSSSYYGSNNEPLPTTSFNTLIAPFWDDINLYYGGSVRYQVLGQAPSRSS